MSGQKVALIFGASGVTGWSFVNEILHDYPKDGIWGGVFALTNRPLSRERSQWPKDDRLTIVSGVNLLEGSQEELNKTMKEKVLGVEKVTHLIYLAYKAGTDLPKELQENTDMFKRALLAVDKLSPGLEFVVLQTGAKHYGCHLLQDRPQNMIPPMKETLPRLQPPFTDLFYYPQLDFLESYGKDQRWGWSDPRPDIIVGFVPNQNFYSLGTALGVYLSLRREIDGEDADCPFPGTQASWVAKSNDSSADMIARQTIHTMLTPPFNTRKGEAWNVADEKTTRSWQQKWPDLCSYFGLKGVKVPGENPVEVRKYIREHFGEWQKMEEKYGLQTGHADNPRIYPGFEYFLLTQFDQDRQYDMTKMYELAGFKEERDTLTAWGAVFERMRTAKIIPARFT